MPNYRIIKKIDDFGPLISPVRDQSTPIHNWHSFKHSYSRELVKKLIEEFELSNGDWVLDPFCGGGTTLLACKELGINSIGYDILPFSVFLSNVKTRNYNIKSIKQRLKIFRSNGNLKKISTDLPNINIINKAFDKKVKIKLLELKNNINRIREEDIKNFYMLGLLSILESLSNTSKSGGFLRIIDRDVSSEDVFPTYIQKINKMIGDLEFINKKSKSSKVQANAKLADSRKFSTRKKFDAIITSPPYPNRHDYTRIYSLEMIFNFVKNNDELKKIRYNTLRSHVEARKRFDSNGYKKPKIINKLITQIRKSGLNNIKVPDTIEGYFEDMYLSLCQMKKHLKRNGKIGLVISNVRYGGVSIPVDEILSEIGEQIGLKTKAIWLSRYRGNSSQQMKEYKRNPSRESIIVWENN